MFERQQAAMACVRKFGRPDLIITETTNPRWPEIFDSLTPGQQPHDRPDLLVRVFRLKIQNVLNFKSLVYRMHLFFFGCHMMPNSISGTIFFICVHCPKTQALSLQLFFPIYFRRLPQNQSKAGHLS